MIFQDFSFGLESNFFGEKVISKYKNLLIRHFNSLFLKNGTLLSFYIVEIAIFDISRDFPGNPGNFLGIPVPGK